MAAPAFKALLLRIANALGRSHSHSIAALWANLYAHCKSQASSLDDGLLPDSALSGLFPAGIEPTSPAWSKLYARFHSASLVALACRLARRTSALGLLAGDSGSRRHRGRGLAGLGLVA